MMPDKSKEILSKASSRARQILNLVGDDRLSDIEVVNLFVCLDCLYGGVETNMRGWLIADNKAFGGVPAIRMFDTVDGKREVLTYLAAMVYG